MVHINAQATQKMIASCVAGFPLEACGLLIGTAEEVVEVFPARNEAASARVYSVHPLDLLKADRHAESQGLELIGVYHSHTHSEPFPSPTDVAQAPDPQWLYIIVSLRQTFPEVRAYRIREGNISEEPLVVKSSKL